MMTWKKKRMMIPSDRMNGREMMTLLDTIGIPTDGMTVVQATTDIPVVEEIPMEIVTDALHTDVTVLTDLPMAGTVIHAVEEIPSVIVIPVVEEIFQEIARTGLPMEEIVTALTDLHLEETETAIHVVEETSQEIARTGLPTTEETALTD